MLGLNKAPTGEIPVHPAGRPTQSVERTYSLDSPSPTPESPNQDLSPDPVPIAQEHPRGPTVTEEIAAAIASGSPGIVLDPEEELQPRQTWQRTTKVGIPCYAPHFCSSCRTTWPRAPPSRIAGKVLAI